MEDLTELPNTGTIFMQRVLEPVTHPDVIIALPRIARELKQLGGESWAVGEMVERVAAFLAPPAIDQAPA